MESEWLSGGPFKVPVSGKGLTELSLGLVLLEHSMREAHPPPLLLRQVHYISALAGLELQQSSSSKCWAYSTNHYTI